MIEIGNVDEMMSIHICCHEEIREQVIELWHHFSNKLKRRKQTENDTYI